MSNADIKKEFYSLEWFKKAEYQIFAFLYLQLYCMISSAVFLYLQLYCMISSAVFIRFRKFDIQTRSSTIEYIDQVTHLGKLFELLAEALGLKQDHLVSMGCAKGRTFVCHHYPAPACPKPEMTLGTSKHTNLGFLAIVLQDQIVGLQVLKNNQRIDVQPLAG
ncbi:deacetoxyvindoline 4-hydroxylase-like [Olea europaea var. sylvestris]|uniref:deacetoxyvindoline 4-hydroxylase-like n=1 Tax=Olea europaea var. sylvestris TaxID=158386 RepID=UPI000C1D2CF5|nr:deacetoxyvindoline 4-hydroxylase-like [Olea europaea var. sylvestris]